MRLAITGTPGTGKSTVAAMVSDMLGWPLIDTNMLLTRDFVLENDTDRDSFVVDIERAAAETKLPGDCVLDGHLSHFFPADFVAVLRCRPKELQVRLEAKLWSRSKVAENVEAEAMNMVSDEARKFRDSVGDIDTSGDSPQRTAEKVIQTSSGNLPAKRVNFYEYL